MLKAYNQDYESLLEDVYLNGTQLKHHFYDFNPLVQEVGVDQASSDKVEEEDSSLHIIKKSDRGSVVGSENHRLSSDSEHKGLGSAELGTVNDARGYFSSSKLPVGKEKDQLATEKESHVHTSMEKSERMTPNDVEQSDSGFNKGRIILAEFISRPITTPKKTRTLEMQKNQLNSSAKQSSPLVRPAARSQLSRSSSVGKVRQTTSTEPLSSNRHLVIKPKSQRDNTPSASYLSKLELEPQNRPPKPHLIPSQDLNSRPNLSTHHQKKVAPGTRRGFSLMDGLSQSENRTQEPANQPSHSHTSNKQANNTNEAPVINERAAHLETES